jgi:hypothetical protein
LRIALSLLVAAVVPFASARAQVTVSLRTEAVALGRLIRIGDVASVEGDEPALVRRVSSVLVGMVPRSGDIKTIALDYIRARIHQEGMSLSRVAVRGRGWVAVSTAPADFVSRDTARESANRAEGAAAVSDDVATDDIRGRSPLVAAGKRVTVLLETACLTIADEAEALEAGDRGHVIPVRNLRSGMTYRARVVDGYTVAVLP